MGKNKNNRKEKKRKLTKDDIVLELSHKSEELSEIKAELQKYKSIWTNQKTKQNHGSSTPVSSDEHNSQNSNNPLHSSDGRGNCESNSSSHYDTITDVLAGDHSHSTIVDAEADRTIDEPILNGNADSALDIIQRLERRCNCFDDYFNQIHRWINKDRQYSFNEDLLIYDLGDVPLDKYDYDFIVYIVDKLNFLLPNLTRKITVDDVNDAHPLSNKENPVVIIQFNKRWLKNMIMTQRKSLRQKQIRISDHLTENNLELLKKAKAIVGNYYAFSIKCKLFACVPGDKRKIPIRDDSDIEFLKCQMQEASSKNVQSSNTVPKEIYHAPNNQNSWVVPRSFNRHQSGMIQNNTSYSTSNTYAAYQQQHLNWNNHTFSQDRGRGYRRGYSRGNPRYSRGNPRGFYRGCGYH